MATVHTESARDGLNRMLARIVLAAGFALRDAMTVTEDNAKATALFKDRSGKTRKSIRAETLGNGYRGRVIARWAATFLENGTIPHIIRGKDGGMLRFVKNGAVVFRRMVRHPGTAERPFMTTARNRGQISAEYAAELYVGQAIRRS